MTRKNMRNLETVEVFEKDASHGLSYEKLVYNLNKVHPRVLQKDETSKIIQKFIGFSQEKYIPTSLCLGN
jgi:hypothetical protein